ncbi:MAG: lasso peptide [Fischerella sp.]|jgi:hypothetical protein|uniref:lasso peptide n=1 Tax=unclassified Fischerella TaxID=494603 RepID=UPI000478B0A8|nr:MULTISPECIES: lasso peptide [unclassified Fischerella]NWF57752.1 lasso peptide [Fischerella sp.]
MKKTYSTPILTTHGSVEAITQMFGTSKREDFLFFSGNASSPNGTVSLTGGTGSVDGILFRCDENGLPEKCPKK